MSEQHIKNRITESLKELTQQAMAADEILTTLDQENKGKFSAIFPKGSTFSTSATRFLPYLEEVNADLENLPVMDDEGFQGALQTLLNKIGKLYEILNAFHDIRDE